MYKAKSRSFLFTMKEILIGLCLLVFSVHYIDSFPITSDDGKHLPSAPFVAPDVTRRNDTIDTKHLLFLQTLHTDISDMLVKETLKTLKKVYPHQYRHITFDQLKLLLQMNTRETDEYIPTEVEPPNRTILPSDTNSVAKIKRVIMDNQSFTETIFPIRGFPSPATFSENFVEVSPSPQNDTLSENPPTKIPKPGSGEITEAETINENDASNGSVIPRKGYLPTSVAGRIRWTIPTPLSLEADPTLESRTRTLETTSSTYSYVIDRIVESFTTTPETGPIIGGREAITRPRESIFTESSEHDLTLDGRETITAHPESTSMHPSVQDPTVDGREAITGNAESPSVDSSKPDPTVDGRKAITGPAEPPSIGSLKPDPTVQGREAITGPAESTSIDFSKSVPTVDGKEAITGHAESTSIDSSKPGPTVDGREAITGPAESTSIDSSKPGPTVDGREAITGLAESTSIDFSKSGPTVDGRETITGPAESTPIDSSKPGPTVDGREAITGPAESTSIDSSKPGPTVDGREAITGPTESTSSDPSKNDPTFDGREAITGHRESTISGSSKPDPIVVGREANTEHAESTSMDPSEQDPTVDGRQAVTETAESSSSESSEQDSSVDSREAVTGATGHSSTDTSEENSSVDGRSKSEESEETKPPSLQERERAETSNEVLPVTSEISFSKPTEVSIAPRQNENTGTITSPTTTNAASSESTTILSEVTKSTSSELKEDEVAERVQPTHPPFIEPRIIQETTTEQLRTGKSSTFENNKIAGEDITKLASNSIQEITLTSVQGRIIDPETDISQPVPTATTKSSHKPITFGHTLESLPQEVPVSKAPTTSKNLLEVVEETITEQELVAREGQSSGNAMPSEVTESSSLLEQIFSSSSAQAMFRPSVSTVPMETSSLSSNVATKHSPVLVLLGSSTTPFPPLTTITKCADVPFHSGGCLGYFIRYSYVPELRKCAPFVYGGCNQTGNNFETYKECVDTCNPQVSIYGSYWKSKHRH